MNEHIQYVNWTMNEINSLCSDLYESLCDKDPDEISNAVKKLLKALKDIQKSNDDYVKC